MKSLARVVLPLVLWIPGHHDKSSIQNWSVSSIVVLKEESQQFLSGFSCKLKLSSYCLLVCLHNCVVSLIFISYELCICFKLAIKIKCPKHVGSFVCVHV